MTRPVYRFDRRTLLAAAAGGAVAGCGGGGAISGGDPQPRWRMRLSTSTIQFSKLSVEDACKRIADLGFAAVDIWSAHAGCPHLDDVQKRLGPEKLKALLKKLGLKLYAFSVYRGGYRKYAKLLGEAGGGVAVRGSTRAAKGKDLVPRMKAFLESLKPEIELAERYDSYLAIENHGGALLNTPDSFKAFTDLNTSRRLGIALAPYHLQRLGASIPETIGIAGDQLLFFYAWQAAKGTGQLPGHGPMDFTPIIAALAETGYRYYVNPFMHHEPEPEKMTAALARSRDYLQDCYKKAITA